MSSNTALTMLQLLDSSLWVNGIRYAISANVMLTNGFLLFLYWKSALFFTNIGNYRFHFLILTVTIVF